MKNQKTKEQLISHKDDALKKLDILITEKINSDSEREMKSADLLSYWIEDYARFLKKERTFDSSKIIRYRKGDIVKMHLGYRLGSEEGGLHYGVVFDVNNSLHSNTVTVIPLTSHKKGKRVHSNDVYLGKELFQTIIGKHDALFNEIQQELKAILSNPNSRLSQENVARAQVLHDKLSELETLRANILKMKEGSIALVKQVVTISKMRIYDPMYQHHVLYGIRLSPTTISVIDEKFCELFISKKN
ncbi:MAG: type II toxin-antitoxin system PemK/MazF family toxin [Mogibacterium sp.]|nr:type II toxin-antitoxin system PemK/MazF family toxin [Mogibacterium sp.]